MIFEWDPGDPILLQTDYDQVTPPLHQTFNEEPKGDVGHDIIIFREKQREIIDNDESPDEPGG